MDFLKRLLGSNTKLGAIAIAAATLHQVAHGHVSVDQIVAGLGAAVSLFGLGHAAQQAEAFLLAVAADVAKLSPAVAVPAPPPAP